MEVGTFLIIAIVLSLFLTLGFISNQDKEKEEKNKNLVMNLDFEKELVKKITNPDYRQEILAIIKDDLEYVYGDIWKELFNAPWREPKFHSNAFTSAENIVLFLLLSKSGLVPFFYHYGRIQIGNSEIANTYECLKILHCVERNIIKRRDPDDFKLIFNPKIHHESNGKRPGPVIPEYEYPHLGEFNWAFDSFRNKDSYAITDIHNPLLIVNCQKSSTGKRSNNTKYNPYKDKLII